MGETNLPAPVLLITAVFSRHDSAFDWARAKCETAWGKIALASDRFDFVETDYYRDSMGDNLKKQFWAFDELVDPGTLPEIKLQTNRWEQELADQRTLADERPLNLDPGYLSLAKLVLASTKDHAHRIYLARGIYAEVTITFRHRQWHSHPWTFPDYQRDDYHRFFDECRDYLRGRRDAL